MILILNTLFPNQMILSMRQQKERGSVLLMLCTILLIMNQTIGDLTYDTVDKPHAEDLPNDDTDDIVRPIIPEVLPVSVDELGKYVLDCHANGEWKI